MIKKESVIKIGTFNKTHGIKGELQLLLHNDLLESTDPDYIICNMDGILVPFFIVEYRFTTDDSVFIILEDINDNEAASRFVKLDAYLEQRQVGKVVEEPISHYSWTSFIGYKLMDQEASLIGEITDVDDTTWNTLFIVDYNGEEILIPAQDELILDIDEAKKEIKSIIPEGLLSM